MAGRASTFMKEPSADESIVLTIAQCAAQLAVSPGTIMKWTEGGHLCAFYPPGKKPSDGQPGPSTLRVFKANWENFLRARTMTGIPKPAQTVAPARPIQASRPPYVPLGLYQIMGPDGPVPTGTDGRPRCISKTNLKRLVQYIQGLPVDPPAVEVVLKNGVRQRRPPKRTPPAGK